MSKAAVSHPDQTDGSSNDDALSSYLEQTIQTMEAQGLLLSPQHGHSFQQVNFSLSLRSECIGCKQRLQNIVFGLSTGVVRCVACNATAHRTCALSKSRVWDDKDKCKVNLESAKGGKDNSASADGQESDLTTDTSVAADTNVTKVDHSTIYIPSSDTADEELEVTFVYPSAIENSRLDEENETATTINIPTEFTESDGESSDIVDVPLHFANHPFASVSRALQENILAFYNRNKLNNRQKDAIDVSVEDASVLAEKVDCDAASDTTNEQHPVIKFASGTYQVVKTTVNFPRRLGAATVAGGIAGGFAGLAMAGPAGAMAGYRFGQACGALGVILEGSVSVGVFVASIATASYTAQHIQDQIQERRILTMGEDGISRKVLLVRPDIQIDHEWEAICTQARQQAPKRSNSSGMLSYFYSSSSNSNMERYSRDEDIVKVGEDELPTNDKVLLLASRILNDKTSLPGFVYRSLVQTLRDRASNADRKTDPRLCRDDAHAVIKYVTATLLDVRPGFGASPALTEQTATAVESLVFGELYTLVYDEIVAEVDKRDCELNNKIAKLHQSATITNDSISQKALASLALLPLSHTPVEKLRCCVEFLENISDYFTSLTATEKQGSALCADSLLKMVCHHIVAARMDHLNAEVAFLEDFARDEQLLRGREGYALVTLQASLHFMNASKDIEKDVFSQDDSEENVIVTA